MRRQKKRFAQLRAEIGSRMTENLEIREQLRELEAQVSEIQGCLYDGWRYDRVIDPELRGRLMALRHYLVDYRLRSAHCDRVAAEEMAQIAEGLLSVPPFRIAFLVFGCGSFFTQQLFGFRWAFFASFILGTWALFYLASHLDEWRYEAGEARDDAQKSAAQEAELSAAIPGLIPHEQRH